MGMRRLRFRWKKEFKISNPNIKIFLHSDQTVFNNKVDKRLFEILNPQDIKVGYIPSTSDRERRHFKIKKEWYMKYGVNNFIYFDLDEEYDESKVSELFKCDLIHLSGGNTFNFLENIRKRNFKNFLVEYLSKGGVLVGVSAGSYVMTPTIKLTTLYKEEPPIMDYTGMSLVDFEFLPHYQEKENYLDMFLEYSKENDGRTVYLCKDNSGVYVNDSEIELIGDIITIRNGEIIN
jgi:dipeptidase E